MMAFIYEPERRARWHWLLMIAGLSAVIGGLLWVAVICVTGRATGATHQRPYTCTDRQMEAGECLQLLKEKHGTMEFHIRQLPIDGDIGSFGEYSPAYYIRRWRRMCVGPQRYDAMREADAMGRPMPCP